MSSPGEGEGKGEGGVRRRDIIRRGGVTSFILANKQPMDFRTRPYPFRLVAPCCPRIVHALFQHPADRGVDISKEEVFN